MKKKAIITVVFFLYLATGVQLSSAQESSPYSLTYPPPINGSSTEKTDPGTDLQGLAITPKPSSNGSVPPSTGFDYPVGGASNHAGFTMNNCFGCTWTWMVGHTGEDFDNGRGGDPVYSVSEGVVVFRGAGGGAWGNVMIIQHNVRGRMMYSQYAHLQGMHVVPGQTVGRRQQIGTVGTTGTVAPHLHFEIKDQPIIGHGYAGWSHYGTSLYVWGANYYAPSWYIENNRRIDSPFGYIDSAVLAPGKYTFSGWTIDPSSSDSIFVHMYLDGLGVAVTAANKNRPDLSRHFPASGPYHGFTKDIYTSLGKHTLCVYGINVGPGYNNLIDCIAIDYPSVTGNLDYARINSPGQLSLSGWALDPDITGPVDVHIYVDGQPRAAITAKGSRSDVGAAYPAFGGDHGYSTLVGGITPGSHTVCAYGISVGQGGNALLACKVVEVPVTPFGSLDGVWAGTPGRLNVGGWAIDPETGSPIDIHVYVNGQPGAVITADGNRPDVGKVFSGYGSYHGFGGSVPVKAQINTVCAYGINVGAGGNALLGCKTVSVPVNPFGSLDGVSAGAPGELKVSGWAIDPNATGSIDVHIYVDGQPKAAITANSSRPDVGAAYPVYGNNHGYSTVVGNLSHGPHVVCTYGINEGAGGNVLLGCRIS